jgi:hypothetical protein
LNGKGFGQASAVQPMAHSTKKGRANWCPPFTPLRRRWLCYILHLLTQSSYFVEQSQVPSADIQQFLALDLHLSMQVLFALSLRLSVIGCPSFAGIQHKLAGIRIRRIYR